MPRKILVLFETVHIRKEVIRYATGLAKRTDSNLTLLIILHPNYGKGSNSKDVVHETTGLEKMGKEALWSQILDIERERVKVTAEVRIGDPPSEFLKFLAKNSPFQTVIWGGMDTYVKGKYPKIERHWLGRVENIIHCPLVVPSSKLYER